MTDDDAMIAAYVDGELDAAAAQRVRAAAANDAALAERIAGMQALRVQLGDHYAPVLDEPLPDRLTALLRKDAVVDTSLAVRRAEKDEVQRLRFAPAHWGAMAASLLIGLTAGAQLLAPESPVQVTRGTLAAAGPLAEALDSQLASAPVAGGTRIGLTFRARDQRWCRTFESAAVSGIGCRSGGSWRLESLRPGTSAAQYRQATSGSLAAEAAAMMAGDPLDAADERAGRDGGWR